MKKLTPRVFQISLTASLLASCSPAVAQFIPGDVSSVGLTRAVPDVPIWYDATNNRVQIGPIVPVANQFADLNNWEPWVSVIGEKVFTIECNKFADDLTLANERYVVALQPAVAGTYANARLAEGFYDDAGHRYTNAVSSRQDGNPGRVYGDRRYDAVNFAVGAEADPQDHIGFFDSGGRFNPNDGGLYQNAFGLQQRCGLLQCYSLNMSTLVQTPLCLAFDGNSLGHPEFAALTSASNQQRGRFGGGIAALDNGNFAAAFNDRSSTEFFPGGNPGNSAIACVFTPTGGVVKSTFLLAPNEEWTDPCGFKGGFCARVGGPLNTNGVGDSALFFFDNSGNPIATNYNNQMSGLSLDTGRGDGSKMAGDIRTPYVFFATGGWMTVWNGTNGTYITKYQYTSDLDPANTVNRTDVACDSLGTVCVAWDGKPTTAVGLGTNTDQSFVNNQTMARVFHFDGTTVTPTTHTFFPFVNNDSDTNNIVGFDTENCNLEMTTRYICIAAKGKINSTNNVAAGPDSAAQTTVYTIISNPGYIPPKMTVTPSGSNLIISWAASAGDCVLQSTPTASPTAWADVSPQPATVLVNGATFQKTVPIGAGNKYFRLASL